MLQDAVLAAVAGDRPLSTRQVTDAANGAAGPRPLVVEQVYRTLLGLKGRGLVGSARPRGRRDVLWYRRGDLVCEVLSAASGESANQIAYLVNGGRSPREAYSVEQICEALCGLEKAGLLRKDVSGPGTVLVWFADPAARGTLR